MDYMSEKDILEFFFILGLSGIENSTRYFWDMFL